MSMLSVRNVGKQYRLRRETRMFTNELLRRLLRRYRAAEFWALKGIAFDVEAGESLGIIGPNGSGKSTLLRIIAGVTECTEGEVSVQGRVASLLELGAGFHPYLTGRENVYLNGAILGIKKEEIDRNFARIVEFAGIERFIDVPVKDYSSGMYVRLAFSVAIHSDPDIFLVDEVLAVGDEEFQQKCRAKIRELQNSGKTIVFVSHDLNIVNELCDRVILLREGRIVEKGSAERTINFYLQSIGKEEGIAFLKAGSLELIFNNGKIALFNEGKMLTRAYGGYSSIFSRGMWYESTSANWHVESCTEDELVATGKFSRIPISQTWRVKLETSSTILWDVEMEGESGAEIPERNVSLLLTGSYTRWFTELAEAEFPVIGPSDTQWTPMFQRDEHVEFIGAEPPEEDAGLPTIFLETRKRSPLGSLHVLNSDYALNSRVLQTGEMRPDEHRQLTGEKELFVSARITLGLPMERIRERLNEARKDRMGILKRGSLSLIFEKGGFHLFLDDREITKGYGAYSSILSRGMWIDSLTAQWRVESHSDTELVAIGISRRTPIRQIWRIKLESPTAVRWSVEMEVQDDTVVSRRHVSLILPTEYTRWFTEKESGKFPTIHPDETEWIHVSHRDEQVKLMVAAPEEVAPDSPVVSVEAEMLAPGVAFHVINSSYALNSRVLQILELHPGDHGELLPGRKPFASTVIHLDRSEELVQERLSKVYRGTMVLAGNLNAVFDRGKIRLLWMNEEITRDRCVFASIRSGDLWDDSVQGRWRVEHVSPDELRATGTMLRLPVVQEWTLRTCEDGTLEWKICLDVREKLRVEELVVSAMLSPEYDSWATAHETGTFPPFASRTNQWTHLARVLKPGTFAEAGCANVAGVRPRTVRMSFGEPWIAVAANTGSLETARVIQGVKQYPEGAGVLEPGRHEVFSAKILACDD
jgi:ABC-type polysaccharide/polyol phosphate transport system ATPase subunit